MKKLFSLFFTLLLIASIANAQRITDKLDRGLIAQKVSGGMFLSWRILGEEYYDVCYNVYRDGIKITETPLEVSNFKDTAGNTSSTYTVAAVVRGKEQAQSKPARVWSKGYMEINPKHDASLKSTYVPNDACCADVDGDGELEILLKYDNADEIGQSYPKNGPTIGGKQTKEYSLFECLKLDGTVLWWVNCGPNMGDFQNNEQNIVAYDWDCDGKAEAVFRAADGTTIHMGDGTTYTVGNANINYRGETGGGTNWFMHDGAEYLLYVDGQTGKPYQCMTFPLARLEAGETDLNAAWGDGYGHRSSKYFFGAPYLDGKKPSIFLARGIYTRHKMIAYDVDPASHKLIQRWKWYNNSNGPWKGQGYHNYGIADVDWDGRDEIVFGSMVIDDNGKGLSTAGLGHGDAQHVSDFNPYEHGQEFFACNEDRQGFNYRNATTSKIYASQLGVGKDVGRSMCGNFTDEYPGCVGTAWGDPISTVKNEPVSGLISTGINSNMRIYWDGDLCSETFNYLNGANTEGCVAKYGSWTPIYTCEGSMTNNDTKGTPCYQGDILGDWREEIIMRTANNRIRIYSTPTPTTYRNYTLWHDHQYRNAMVWQMCGYNQPPHTSYFLGKLEGITVAPPPLTNTNRHEVADGGTIGASLNDKHVIFYENKNSSVTIENGAKPYILTFNVPTWVQGSAASECTTKDTKITYTTYTCNVSGGGITGEARLVKQGDGVLNLPKADFTHTGETNIWAGTLNFDGTMKNSPLWLNRFAELNSDGGSFKSIKADYASIIRPGGAKKIGSITVDEILYLGFGSRIIIDMNGADLSADIIKAKNITLERKTGNTWIKGGPKYLQPVIEVIGTNLVAGDYVIANVETIEGSLANIKVEGITDFPTSLSHKDGKLILTLGGVRGANYVTWTGATNSTWDFANSENFVLTDDEEQKPITFVKGDLVEINDNAMITTIEVVGALSPDTVFVNNTKAITIKGDGNIADGALVKEGKGTLTMNGINSYKGGNFLKGGIVKVSSLANDTKAEGNLGALLTNAAKFTMENAATLQPTGAVTNGSPIQMKGEEGGVINNSADFVQQKALSGTVLTKKGNGWLKLEASNPSLNKLIIAAGTVDAYTGSAAKLVELQGTSYATGSGFLTVPINVAAKAKGYLTTINRATSSNKITGTGQITIYCATEKGSNYYATRSPMKFDLTSFEGTLVAGATYTADGRFTFDTQNGGDKWTLNIPTGIIVQNSGKTMNIGNLTGTGNLGGFCTFSNNGASGTNTWTVGNDKDFKFEGKVIGGDKFNKVGTGKMTTTGVWETTGAIAINGGELHINSSSTLGTGTLTIGKDATLSGTTKAGTPMSNSSFTFNGTLYVGSSSVSTTGEMDFNGKNVTFNAGSFYTVNLRIASAAEDKMSGASMTNINKLTMNGTIMPYLSESYAPKTGDVLRLWNNVKSFAGTPKYELPDTHTDKNGDIYTITWDTSDIAKGLIKVASVSVESGIAPIIAADEDIKVDVIASNGTVIATYYCQMADAERKFRENVSVGKGVYILKIYGKQAKTSKKVMR